jgi:hypothetical protein
MHATHLGDHWVGSSVRNLLGSEPLPHGRAAQAAALRATSPLAASSASPVPLWGVAKAEVFATDAPDRRSEHRHHPADS